MMRFISGLALCWFFVFFILPWFINFLFGELGMFAFFGLLGLFVFAAGSAFFAVIGKLFG